MEDKIKSLEKVFSMKMMGESKKLFEKDYFGCVEYLLKKYGAVTDDYFINKNCRSKGKFSRTKDGLFCHHIYEYEYPLICNPDIACCLPYELQLKENLCYCNILEHLILHIKIDDEYRNHDYGCGTTVICQTIAKYLACNSGLLSWENNCKKALTENLNNLVTLGYILGYLMTVESLLNKENCIDKCKAIGFKGKYFSNVMLDLLWHSLSERLNSYKTDRTDYHHPLWEDIIKYEDVEKAIEESLSLVFKTHEKHNKKPYHDITNISEILCTHQYPQWREYQMTYDDIGEFGYNPKKRFNTVY